MGICALAYFSQRTADPVIFGVAFSLVMLAFTSAFGALFSRRSERSGRTRVLCGGFLLALLTVLGAVATVLCAAKFHVLPVRP